MSTVPGKQLSKVMLGVPHQHAGYLVSAQLLLLASPWAVAAEELAELDFSLPGTARVLQPDGEALSLVVVVATESGKSVGQLGQVVVGGPNPVGLVQRKGSREERVRSE